MDKIVPDLLRTYRSRSVYPVIIETRKDVFDKVRSSLREIVPIRLLEARFHTFMPRIMPLIEFPLTKWKELKTFNMIATVLTPNLIEEVAQWREVQRVYPDYVKWALQTVPPEGIFKDYKEKLFTSTYWTKRMLGVDRANRQGFTGKRITTVVIDTGARITHEQLTRVKALTAMPEKGGSGDDSNGHGSWCTSCVGGTYAIDRRYNVPVEGMAPECTLTSIQALGWIIGMGTTSDVLQAMEMSIGLDAKVVSMSLGSDDAPKDEDNPEAKAINELVNRGIIPCIAAGNSGPDPETLGSPGSCLNSLTVGAWDEIKGEIADFSSRGPTAGDGYIKPDIVAPGVRVNSALIGLLDQLTDKTQTRFGPISGTCLTADSLVYKNGVPTPINELKVDDVVYTFENGKLSKKRVLNVIHNGKKPVFKLVLNGKTIRATDNHPFLALEREFRPEGERKKTHRYYYRLVWKPINQLRRGDCILTLKKIVSDAAVDKRFDRLLGFMIGDGWVSKGPRHLQTCTSYGEKAPKYVALLEELFDTKMKLYEHKKGAKWYYCYDRNVGETFLKYGLDKGALNKEVSPDVFLWNVDARRKFIFGYLDADGSLQKSGQWVVETPNMKLVYQLHELAIQSGLRVSNVRFRDRRIKAPNSKKFQIKRFWTFNIGSTLMIYGGRRIDRVPKNLFDFDKFSLERVVEIVPDGIDEVYDITVENSHNFIANGIVVHNSMATPHVAGFVTCLAQLYREKLGMELTVDEVKRMAEALGHPKSNDDGFGLLTWSWIEQWLSTEYSVEV